MTFYTKFNVLDTAWYMKNNVPTEVIISAIRIFYVNTDQDTIMYNAKDAVRPQNWLDHTEIHEFQLFNTKAELLASL